MLQQMNPVIPVCFAVQHFLRRCDAADLSPATLRAYRYVLYQFARHFVALPQTADEIDEYMASLKHLAKASKCHHWRHLRAFFRHCAKRLRAVNPVLDAEPPKRPKGDPKALTDRQVKALLSVPLSRRDRAIITLLLDSGPRLGELTKITPDDIGEDRLTVTGKTGRRHLPLSPNARRSLIGVPLPWTDRHGRPLTQNGVYQVVERALWRAGIIEGGPHRLRHTFAVHYITAGGDLESLRQILGHASIQSTIIYLNMITPQVAHQHTMYSRLLELG